jgi:hypothetical protein
MLPDGDGRMVGLDELVGEDRPDHIEAVDADPAQAARAGVVWGKNANAKLGQLHEIVLAHHGMLSSELEIALARKLGEGGGQFAIGASQQALAAQILPPHRIGAREPMPGSRDDMEILGESWERLDP